MRRNAGPVVLAAILVACSSSDSANDDVAPACNAVSPEGLATEQTAGGQCPTPPRTLIGTVMVGDSCSQSTDCVPSCCPCAAGGSADVAQCSGGKCLDGATACCLYSLQCGQ